MRRDLAAAAAVLALAACASGPETAAEDARVARVVDGDTIELVGGNRVRLVQVDAPEAQEDECYAAESAATLDALLPRGAPVRLEPDRRLDDTDRFGRLLRYIHRDDLNV